MPIIGLSATPFRGTSEVETERLVKRFGGHRFDDFESDPYPMLQDMGVLSNVRHVVLSGSNVELTPKELEHLKRTRLMPPSALERIGVDAERNQAILDSIADLPEDATVLLFATSVAHAELLAGLLSLEGIPAQAVSGRTPRGARRHYIERFRAGGNSGIDELRRIHRGVRCSCREGGLCCPADVQPESVSADDRTWSSRAAERRQGGVFHRQCEGQPCGVRRAACVHRVRVPLERGVVMSGLTEEQRAVSEAPVGARQLVIAGPGTGKTHTLVARLAHLVEEEEVFSGSGACAELLACCG